MTILSDYVVDFLVKRGIKDIFLVSGGGIMYLIDAVGRNKKITYIANHHEQASATAAESYARVKNQISACLVTTGPGGTNAITGVAGAWVDSIPMIVISGQVRTALIADYSKIRQIGPQEINIVDIVKPVTKYAKTIMQPNDIKYELEKAFYLATEGRPGPVWLDVPLDVQSAEINEKELKGFTIPSKKDNDRLKIDVAKTVELLKNSKRPVIILGNGVRLSGAEKLLTKFLGRVGAPVILPIGAMDLVPEENELLVGKFGPVGQRRGNFALQNSDLILSIGSSMSLTVTGFDLKSFATKAKKIVVNIDKGMFSQAKINIDLPILSDASKFVEEFLSQTKKTKFSFPKKWLNACINWKQKYPNIVPEFLKDKKHVNSYVFFDKLSDFLSEGDIVTTGIALDVVSLFQAFKVKKNQRAFVNTNFGQMGWCLPAAVGTAVANKGKRVICVTGDGSLQFNSQELETIKHYNLPVKLFIFNNGGYESIRATQNNHFNGLFVGADEKSGVTNPDFKKLAQAHKLQYEKILDNSELEKVFKKVLSTKGPVLCEVNISYDQMRMPKASSFKRKDGVLESKPLEDMFPFLPRKEIYENMHIFDEKEI